MGMISSGILHVLVFSTKLLLRELEGELHFERDRFLLQISSQSQVDNPRQEYRSSRCGTRDEEDSVQPKLKMNGHDGHCPCLPAIGRCQCTPQFFREKLEQ